MIKVGLKNNALFLFEQMNMNCLGGITDGIFHNKVIHLTKSQFKKFKNLIILFGYCVDKSLTPSNRVEVDFSCYLLKL